MTATANNSFLALTASDLMSRDLTMLPRTMSLRAAADLLSEMQISGAPVVDESGECVGVLSATDFMREAGHGERAASRPPHGNPGCFHSAWQVVDEEDPPADGVEACMTADPVTVSPDTFLAELAREMIDSHIHRLIVVDAQNHPIGVVSSTDLLAAMANAEPRGR